MTVNLYYAVAGTLEIHLDEIRFRRDVSKPIQSVKSFERSEQHLTVESNDLGGLTQWGVVELQDLNSKSNRGYIELTIDTHHWGTAEALYYFEINGVKKTHPISIKSGVRGPVGDPKRSIKIYERDFLN